LPDPLLAGAEANALTTFNWTSLVGSTAGTGQFTIAENIETLEAGNSYEITSISGTFNGITIGTLLPVNSLGDNNNLYYYNTSKFFALDGSGVTFNDSNNPSERYNLYGNSNMSAEAWLSDSSGSGTFTSSAEEAAVPAPLPILGLPAVLFYSRKLKKRIKERNATAFIA
jgi:hypothetical protein